MCLAVPGKLLEIQGNDPFIRSGLVSFGGVIKKVSLACAPEAVVGDYVLVHVGLAISVIDAEEAEKTFTYLKAMGDLDGLDDPGSGPGLSPLSISSKAQAP